MPGQVKEWLDCGNKANMLQTNQRYLEFIKDQNLISAKAKVINSVILPPVFIDDHVVIENSVVGPHVSVGSGTKITDCRLSNSIVQKDCTVNGAVLKDSLLGNFVNFEGKSTCLDLGDYSTI